MKVGAGMKALKWMGGVLGFYVLFVMVFEIGYLGSVSYTHLTLPTKQMV